MFLPYDPDAVVPVVESTTCAYHERFPGKPWPGCMCWVSVGSRQATPDEYRARRKARLTERKNELEPELASINLELGVAP